MTARGLIHVGLLVGLVSATAAGGSPNLIPNNSFADGLAGWQVEFPEANETRYSKNHENVKVISNPKGGGKCLEFSSFGSTAATEGVKACTGLIPIKPGTSYEFGADVLSSVTGVKIFLVGYQKDPEQQTAGDNQIPGYRRIYRKVIHIKGKGDDWRVEHKVATPPERYQPSHVLIKLYAYYPPGKVCFRNVVLQETTEE